MPFTFSHPAIILRLHKVSKSKLSFTGLIVGSLAPDFEYFILMKMQRTHGHELSSFLWFNLPICIALAFIYHLLVKVPLTNSLPHFLYSKLAVYKSFNWIKYFKTYWLVFVYSSALGVFSHIVWDSFTHDHGLFGASPDLLLKKIPVLELKLHELLQWLSTIIGGWFVMKFILKMDDYDFVRRPLLHKFTFWFNVLIVMSFIFTVKQPNSLSELIATSIGSFLYGLVTSASYDLWYEKIYSERNTKF